MDPGREGQTKILTHFLQQGQVPHSELGQVGRGVATPNRLNIKSCTPKP